jgi:thioredoxin reductase (NADPH)
MKNEKKVELVIIGGGSAGMTAAIYAAHANIDTVVLEANITGGLVNSTYTVQNFPTYQTIHGMDLMAKMRDHVDSLNVPIEEVCEIVNLDFSADTKIIETDEFNYQAKSVILATGRKPLKLNVPTESDQVHYCAICDGGPYKNKRVLVVGGGNSAFDESLYLLKLGISHITLVEALDRFFAAQGTQNDLISTEKVIARKGTKVVDLIKENDQLTAVILEEVATGRQETVPMDGVFVFIGQHPNNELFADQISLNDNGYIIAGSDMSTNIAGVFGAGDINEKSFRQITTSMADATIAALSVERYLRHK